MFDKLKELSKDTAIYGISTMVGRFLNFLLVPFYTKVFIPSEYGIVLIAYSYIGILNIIYLYGMDSAYLKYAGMKGKDENDNFFSTSYISVFINALIFSSLIILFKNPISFALHIPASIDYVIYITASFIFLDAVSFIPFIKLRLERKAKLFAVIRIINIAVNIFLNLFLVLALNWGIEAVFVSNLAASFVSFVLLLPTILKYLRIEFSFKIFKQMLRFGLPYLPHGLSMILVQVIDVPILDQLTNTRTVGLYKAVYKLGIFMMLLVNMFQFAWQPFFLQNAREENAKQMFAKVLTYFTLVSSLILISLSLFISDIVKIDFFGVSIIDAKYWSGLYIVPVILFAYMFNGLYVVFSAGIYIEDKSLYVPFVSGAGALVNIAVNYTLIPVMGILGAAFATLASYFVMALGYYLITQKYYKIDYEYSKLGKIFLLVLVTGTVYYVLYFSNEINLIYKFILLLFFISSIYWLVIDRREIQLLKNELKRKRKE